MKTLILYLTTDGQTQRIAEAMASEIQHEQAVYPLAKFANMSAYELEEYDQIVIAASIRYGHFSPVLYQFIERHYGLLNRKKTVFVSVNLTARKANRNTPETNTYTRKFLAKIKWKPSHVEVVAGALYYPRYSFFDRIMIQLIMKLTKGETDASKEYEYTDWEQVKQLGKRLERGL